MLFCDTFAGPHYADYAFFWYFPYVSAEGRGGHVHIEHPAPAFFYAAHLVRKFIGVASLKKLKAVSKAAVGKVLLVGLFVIGRGWQVVVVQNIVPLAVVEVYHFFLRDIHHLYYGAGFGGQAAAGLN